MLVELLLQKVLYSFNIMIGHSFDSFHSLGILQAEFFENAIKETLLLNDELNVL